MPDQSPLQKLHSLQKKEGWTNYEMALMMEISEKTWEHWLNGRRCPRGPSLALVKYVLNVLQGNPVTREWLLAKTGRYGGAMGNR
jgi:DNA-binding transcriptional regulator YiaG